MNATALRYARPDLFPAGWRTPQASTTSEAAQCGSVSPNFSMPPHCAASSAALHPLHAEKERTVSKQREILTGRRDVEIEIEDLKRRVASPIALPYAARFLRLIELEAPDVASTVRRVLDRARAPLRRYR